MAESQHPRGPRIPNGDLTSHAEQFRDGETYRAALITGDFAGLEAADVQIEQSRIAAAFTAARFPRLRLTDVVLEQADLSGADLEESNLTRVLFQGCRLSGVLFPRCRMRDVAFIDCRLDDANLRMLSATRVDFIRVDLREADLYAARLESARFFDCNLEEAQFSQAELPNARLHGSRLSGIKGAEYLKNVVIDTAQILELALPVFGAHGIRIEDDRELGPTA